MDCECGCGRAAVSNGRYAGACYKQRQRKGTTKRKAPERGVRHSTPKAMVLEAHEALNDADPLDDAAQERAWARLRTSWRRYFQRVANTVQRRTKNTSRG